MYAVFESGGKQHQATVGEHLRVEKLDGEKGGKVVFDHVLFMGGDALRVGQPYLPGVIVEGEIARQGLGEKIEVLKRRKRKGFHKKIGHRQPFTEVKITGIKG